MAVAEIDLYVASGGVRHQPCVAPRQPGHGRHPKLHPLRRPLVRRKDDQNARDLPSGRGLEQLAVAPQPQRQCGRVDRLPVQLR